ncbi:MAG: HlyC/CorC family transporter [Polyangiaceae bacterium]|nr:HlyC/CorC family transporter [Polyangiaceae bacterium]
MAAVFSAASAAAGALTPTRLAALAEKLGGADQVALRRYREHGSAIRSRWLVMRALGIVATAVLTASWMPLTGWRGTLAAVSVALLLYTIPTELLRGLAEGRAERSAPLLLRVLRPLELLSLPIAVPLHALHRLTGGSEQQSPAGDEMELFVAQGEVEGSLGHDQSEMIRNVMDFGEVTAADVMVPRTRVTLLSVDCPPAEVMRIVAEQGHSRYPVSRDRPDHIIGVLHVKDILRFLADHPDEEFSVEALMRTPVPFVPEGQPGSTVLTDMRAGRHHLAVVIDEFGGVSGIVTLEDLIEEIVGDIQDEHDHEVAPIVDLGDGRLRVEASVPIGDLSRYLGVDLEDGDFHSLGGFIIDRLGRVPTVGATVSEFGLDFIVTRADERHVVEVEIVREAAAPESVLPKSARSSAA